MEAAGLAVGVVGVATIFTSCIECFQLAQRGRYLGREYLILEAKFANQRLRLLTWGRACGFVDRTSVESSYDSDWDDDVRSAVSDTLTRITTIFRDQRTMAKRYGMLVIDQPNMKSKSMATSSSILGGLVPKIRSMALTDTVTLTRRLMPKNSTNDTSPPSALPAAVRWAIGDKQKFSDLVQHLKDFIDDLEALTPSRDITQRQRCFIREEVGSIQDMSELEAIEEARCHKKDPVADAASLRLCQLQLLQGPPPRTSRKSVSSVPKEAAKLRELVASSSHSDLMAVSSEILQRETSPVPSAPPKQTRSSSDHNDWEDIQNPNLSESDAAAAAAPTYYQTLYRVYCKGRQTTLFLDVPTYYSNTRQESPGQWLVVDSERPRGEHAQLHLTGSRPVVDLSSYLEQNTQLWFLFIQEYDCDHDAEDDVRCRSVAPSSSCIRLVSEQFQSTIEDLLDSPGFSLGGELVQPYSWYYYNRDYVADVAGCGFLIEKNYYSATCRPVTEQMTVVGMMIEILEETLGAFYDDFKKSKFVKWKYLALLFEPGTLVLQKRPDGDPSFRCFELEDREFTSSHGGVDEPETKVFKLEVGRRVYSSIKDRQTLYIPHTLFSGTDEDGVFIGDLPIVPLSRADDCSEVHFVTRGLLYKKVSSGCLIRYVGDDENQAGGEFVADSDFYESAPWEKGLPKAFRRWKVPDVDSDDIDFMFSGEDHVSDHFSDYSMYSEDFDEDPWEECAPIPLAVRQRRYREKRWTYICSPHFVWAFHLRRHTWSRFLLEDIEIARPVTSTTEPAGPGKRANPSTIYEASKASLSRLFGPVAKFSWESYVDPKQTHKIIVTFTGPGREAAVTEVSAITKRPVLRIRLSDTRTQDDLRIKFLKLRECIQRWGCIVLFEDVVEATTEGRRRQQIMPPLLSFVEKFMGISVFLYPSGSDFKSLGVGLDAPLLASMCKHFYFAEAEKPLEDLTVTWKVCLKTRISPLTPTCLKEIREMAERLAGKSESGVAVGAIVDAVLPPRSKYRFNQVDWDLLEQLASGKNQLGGSWKPAEYPGFEKDHALDW